MADTTTFLGYQEGSSFLHRLSATSKFLFFLLVSIASMISFDTRFLLSVAVFALFLFRYSGFRLRQLGLILGLAALFGCLNLLLIYLFAPGYGTEIYGTRTLLLGSGSYALTVEESFYLLNVFLKYICTIPYALLFLLTTPPSQFAASLNQLGISYKVAYSVSLTMRYIPDLQEEFFMIRKSQEARGLELSKKGKFFSRLKGNIQIVTPLIFSSLERINTVATAMELRRFGKLKKRTWYRHQALTKTDWLVILLGIFLLALAVSLIYLNAGRFYNPFSS